MKIVINTSYGSISDDSASKRYNKQFIDDVESGRFVGNFNEHWGLAETLKVVEIPDEATDHIIFNYDGCEGVIYVLDGLIHYICGGEGAERVF